MSGGAALGNQLAGEGHVELVENPAHRAAAAVLRAVWELLESAPWKRLLKR